MAIVTGANGEFRYNGQRIVKCKEVSLQISRDVLETTGIADDDKTFIAGTRNNTGSCTILYDENDSIATQLLNSIYDASGVVELSIVVNKATAKIFNCNAIFTQLGISVSVGGVTACPVQFQVVGKPSGDF